MAQTVIGIFNSEEEAQRAVLQLENDGFTRNNIDISHNSGSSSGNYATTNDGADNSFGDKVSRFFSNLFGDDNDNARYYSEAAKRGSVVTVHAQSNDEAERAVDILDLYGAVDVDEKVRSFGTETNQFSTDYKTPNTPPQVEDDLGLRSSSTTLDEEDLNYKTSTFGVADTAEINDSDPTLDIDRTSERGNSIPIIEENLDLSKKEIETGGVRVRSRIIERPVEESLRLRSEHVVVERTPVNRAATDSELNNFKEESFELTEHAEVPVIRKEARVVEEVKVGKQVENREEVVRDSVRRTDVDVENFKSNDSKDWSDR
jgi:uncharacterized protein (TIGR02271 family)